MKEHVERKITLSKSATTWSPDPHTLPTIVPPKGLSAERQCCLFDTIHEFCPDSDKDLTCLLPATVRHTSSAPGTHARTAPTTGEDDVEPPSQHRPYGYLQPALIYVRGIDTILKVGGFTIIEKRKRAKRAWNFLTTPTDT